MVTSYYLSKISKNKNVLDIDKYFSSLLESICPIKSLRENLSILGRCRVCFKDGTVSVFTRENSLEVIDIIEGIGKITINLDDEPSIKLCHMCLKFVSISMMFREVVRHSDNLLMGSIKQEKNNVTENYNSDIEFDSKDISKNEISNSHTPKLGRLKQCNVKLPSTVTCQICNKVVTRQYYKHHVTMHDTNHKNYICEICGKSFRLQCAYYNHSRRHENGFQYRCKLCPYRGRYAELLKTHMRTHTGDYRYMCTECPARFLFKCNLNSHMWKHKEPQHKCEHCKKAFHTKLMLGKHYEADHLGIKNHVCNICGKAFGYRNALKKHERAVHKREKCGSGRMPAYLQAELTLNNEF